MSERLLETKPGFLQAEFSEEELAEIDQALLEPMNDEELALWYDAPIMPEPELPTAAHELEQ
ncbi:MAG: hypothetical protein K1X65_01740 [Caldilineales bacterium]|nr:hypothetical protein [Caldilineales bacterium]MCW5856750.1 hypothetical protein [Caldilineales bacterium]